MQPMDVQFSLAWTVLCVADMGAYRCGPVSASVPNSGMIWRIAPEDAEAGESRRLSPPRLTGRGVGRYTLASVRGTDSDFQLDQIFPRRPGATAKDPHTWDSGSPAVVTGILSLRDSCTTWLASKGVSMRLFRRFLGHASLRTTQNYSHVTSSAIEGATEDVSAPSAYNSPQICVCLR